MALNTSIGPCSPAIALRLALAATTAVAAVAQTPRVEFEVACDLGVEPAILEITLRASGLPESVSDAVCSLADWGGWTSAPFPYVQDLRIDGAPHVLDGHGSVRLDPELLADGALQIRYDLPAHAEGSRQHRQHPLLPYRSGRHVFGFVRNTLIGLQLDGVSIDRDVVVRVTPKPVQPVFTGWAGTSAGPQTARLPHGIAGNGVFAFGAPRGRATGTVGDTQLEVVQLGGDADATDAVLRVAAAVLPSFARATGRAARDSVRIVIQGPPGGTHTAAGIVIGIRDPGRITDSVKELVAHELFHEWLGHALVPGAGESPDWFTEGFTDYMALWHCAATGVTSPRRFAERIAEIDRQVRASAASGRVPFAERDVRWRDGGPLETLAYRGGAVLAFAIDARLRQRGERSVGDVVRQLDTRGVREFSLDDIRTALSRLDLADVYEQSIAKPHLPASEPLLRAVGFEAVEERKALTYLGIAAERGAPAEPGSDLPVTVTAVDPAGPAARAGVRVGDRIVGLEPLRRSRPELGDGAPADYAFGLTLLATGADTAVLHVDRDGEERRVEVHPKLVWGGRSFGWRWDAERGSDFFTGRD